MSTKNDERSDDDHIHFDTEENMILGNEDFVHVTEEENIQMHNVNVGETKSQKSLGSPRKCMVLNGAQYDPTWDSNTLSLNLFSPLTFGEEKQVCSSEFFQYYMKKKIEDIFLEMEHETYGPEDVAIVVTENGQDGIQKNCESLSKSETSSIMWLEDLNDGEYECENMVTNGGSEFIPESEQKNGHTVANAHELNQIVPETLAHRTKSINNETVCVMSSSYSESNVDVVKYVSITPEIPVSKNKDTDLEEIDLDVSVTLHQENKKKHGGLYHRLMHFFRKRFVN